MSYATCRDGLVTLLQTVSGFDSSNVAHEDFQMLSRGVSQGIVLEYAGMSHELSAYGEEWQDWMLKGTLFVEQTDVVQTKANADSIRDSIVAKLRAYPKLNATPGVFYAHCSGGSPIEEPHELGGVSFLQEQLTFAIREDVSGGAQE